MSLLDLSSTRQQQDFFYYSPPSVKSPITKIIFIHRAGRFACRTLKDVLILNSVCRDFQETVQHHGIFHIALYSAVLPRRSNDLFFFFADFCNQLERLRDAAKSSSWMFRQIVVVDELNPGQSDTLKKLLLFQARCNNHSIMLLSENRRNHHRRVENNNNTKKNADDEEFDKMIRLHFLQHFLETCVKLGIGKSILLEEGDDGDENGDVVSTETTARQSIPSWNSVIVDAVLAEAVDPSVLKLLLDHCRFFGDLKGSLTSIGVGGGGLLRGNCISASAYKTGFSVVDTFKVLIDAFLGLDDPAVLASALEARDSNGFNCVMAACARKNPNCNYEFLKLLLETCAQYGDVKKILEEWSAPGLHNNSALYLAISNNMEFQCFQLLLSFYVKYADVMKVFLEWNVVSIAIKQKLNFRSFQLLLQECEAYPVSEIGNGTCLAAAMLEATELDSNERSWTCIHLALSYGLAVDSFRMLISFYPSKESFRRILERPDSDDFTFLFEADGTNAELLELLSDPDCWEKCREWYGNR